MLTLSKTTSPPVDVDLCAVTSQIFQLPYEAIRSEHFLDEYRLDLKIYIFPKLCTENPI